MTLTNWYESGQKKSEGSCADGKKNGLWTWCYENGNKELEKNYKDNKLDGVSTSWYENGGKRSEQNFKNGKMVGSYTTFDAEIFEDSVDNRLRTTTDFNGNFDYMTLREFAKKDYDLKYELDYGRQIIETPEHLSQYWWTYALMIARQWETIYPCIKDRVTSFIDVNDVEIIDYGCGQGGASLLFLDKFYSDFKKNISKIKLTDAGSMALQRAKMFLENYSSDIKIVDINKDLDDLETKDLETDQNLAQIHLFSNILDVNNFDVDKLFNKITKNTGKHLFLAVSPHRNFKGGSARLGQFYNRFINAKNVDLNWNEFSDPFEFQENRCAVAFGIDLTVLE